MYIFQRDFYLKFVHFLRGFSNNIITPIPHYIFSKNFYNNIYFHCGKFHSIKDFFCFLYGIISVIKCNIITSKIIILKIRTRKI
jgi:hypothetical protein